MRYSPFSLVVFSFRSPEVGEDRLPSVSLGRVQGPPSSLRRPGVREGRASLPVCPAETKVPHALRQVGFFSRATCLEPPEGAGGAAKATSDAESGGPRPDFAPRRGPLGPKLSHEAGSGRRHLVCGPDPGVSYLFTHTLSYFLDLCCVLPLSRAFPKLPDKRCVREVGPGLRTLS